MGVDVLDLAVELRQRGEAFALATVVRCERPTSARPGAKALIRGDGAVTGWVGGACAEPVVVREALKALGDGQPRLVALVGEGGAEARRVEGLVPYPRRVIVAVPSRSTWSHSCRSLFSCWWATDRCWRRLPRSAGRPTST